MSKKVLITGGTGFIGRYTIPFLKERGFEIYAITSKLQPQLPPTLDVTIGSYIYCDLLDPVKVWSVLNEIKPEYLLHLAWDVNNGYQNSLNNIHWMNASLKLLHYFAEAGGRRAVIAGTHFEHNFNMMPSGMALNELTNFIHPKTIYGICKNSLREILGQVDFMKSVELAWGRIFHVYGPHEHPCRLVPSIINGVLQNQKVTVSHTGQNYVDYSYVSDVANGLVTALDSDMTGVFHMATEKPIQIRELVHKICNLMDAPENMVAFGPDEPEFHEVIGRAERLLILGWKPQVDLDRGLIKTINWWKEQIK